jgi:transposase-like protein/transposase Tn5 family protein
MSELSIQHPDAWAEQTFGRVELGDPRRTTRAVRVATALATHPPGSLPQQTEDWAALKGSYRLLHSPQVSHTTLSTPHWLQTREEAGQHPLVLLVGDLTILDYSHHPRTTGLGPVGNGRGRGYVVHSVLALRPSPRQVLGLAHQRPQVPEPKRDGETLRQMQARARQTDLWAQAVTAIGRPPPGVQWVHVGDRGSDIYRFLWTCHEQGCAFLVRAKNDRRVRSDDGTLGSLHPVVRAWPSRAEATLSLPASHGRVAREARVAISWNPLQLQVPRQEPTGEPLDVWVVRVWEPDPPAEHTEPIEWILLSRLPVASEQEAWERVQWYTCRWTIEDYHQCLKTGCRIEERNLGDQPALERLLGLCAPIAVELLKLRDAARIAPDRHAVQSIEPEVVAVVAALVGIDPQGMTTQTFYHAVARRGGWLGRTRDGPPGWKTLWTGWNEIRLILEGVRLARAAPPSTSG